MIISEYLSLKQQGKAKVTKTNDKKTVIEVNIYDVLGNITGTMMLPITTDEIDADIASANATIESANALKSDIEEI